MKYKTHLPVFTLTVALAIALMTTSTGSLSAQTSNPSPSPYEISQKVSNQIGRAIRKAEERAEEREREMLCREEAEYWAQYNRDENAFIEELLLSTNSVAEIDHAMVKIIAKVDPKKQHLALAFLQDKKRELQTGASKDRPDSRVTIENPQ